MKCKQCSKEQHYCSSCDPEFVLDEGFCSWKCYNEYPENIKSKKMVELWWVGLTPKQRTDFQYISNEIPEEIIDSVVHKK